MIEPVQGEGGFNVAPFDFLRALRRICDEHGIVLIADEVQGGIARTGKMFSIEHSGVVPDLITVAKGLGGGFPLSGVTGRATIMDSAHAGGLGRHLWRQSDQHRGGARGARCDRGRGSVRARGAGRRARCARICSRSPRRCRASAMCAVSGAMVAFELVKDPKTKEPDAALTAAILATPKSAA